ncbi:MAG: amino acid permease [Campylobacteraceae bacterium]|jgi:L-asparagine transporter-like permease|nr:amino acid permease [Campylobacteraceae bacterium]
MNDRKLHRALKNRHIQLIALGGAVGTGLFLGTGSAIFLAGPSVLVGYAIVGFLAFLIMRQLGEMMTEEPQAGSFSYFAYKYWGDFAGFLAGWNYWILYVMVSISELTAVAAYMQFWFPELPTWISALIFFVIINIINFSTVKVFGEVEFWFSIIKISAIIAMIIFGLYILFINTSLVPDATIKNLWEAPIGMDGKSGFFANGLYGLVIAIPIIMFSFGGLELVGIAAAEADNPKKTIPKATNQVLFRILVFYIGTIAVLLSLYHWSNLTKESSPFTLIFTDIGFKHVAGILNFVILTAALSVFNSGVYATSRMLFGLSYQGNAPKVFSKLNIRAVPTAAMGLAALLTFMVVPLNYFLPNWNEAFKQAMSVVVAALVINWAMISLAHLFFRKNKDKNGVKTLFPTILYPFGNYLCLAFVVFVLVVMATPNFGMFYSVLAVPIWIVFVYSLYIIFKKKKYNLWKLKL